MVTNFVFRNMTSGKEAKFGQDISCSYLYQSDGLVWGTVPAAHNTYEYPGQVGSTISSTKLNSRDVSVTGYVYYVMSPEEMASVDRTQRVQYGYSKIKEKKRFLNEVINPNDFVRLTVGDYYIEGKPEASVKYGNDDATNNEYFCEFTFAILCTKPMFMKVSQVTTVLAGEEPMFHFPWILDDSEGYVMSIRNAYSILAVENEGDVPVGGKITLEALGDVEAPSIENVVTGEQITITKMMRSGEVVVIDTRDGKEKGVFGGMGKATENYFQFWSIHSSWMKFQQGTTIIGYSTKNASDSLLRVSVDVNPEKFNLEEM